ncbi:hypothetical protein RJ639_006023 [Escallonia herrerae]|uniref:Reverse transcriptase Ty1/copia-type domain-containing protein n=1 Tax=Escallonia herrerae TaxID=1293975 RepID=A0AA89ATU2_9ASTE|nr:hypothetical protein RJ639_006023 [Escallonia herrerae]
MDVKSAFLNDFLDEEKALYGLKQYKHQGRGIVTSTSNNVKMFDDFKKEIAKEFEMIDIGFMSYYLGIEKKQIDDGIFISQEACAKEVLKKFNMENCNPINIPIKMEIKLSRIHVDIEEAIDVTLSTCEAEYVATTSIVRGGWVLGDLVGLWSSGVLDGVGRSSRKRKGYGNRTSLESKAFGISCIKLLTIQDNWAFPYGNGVKFILVIITFVDPITFRGRLILDQKGVIRPPRWLHHLKDQVLGQPGQCSQHTGGLRAEQGLAFQDLGHAAAVAGVGTRRGGQGIGKATEIGGLSGGQAGGEACDGAVVGVEDLQRTPTLHEPAFLSLTAPCTCLARRPRTLAPIQHSTPTPIQLSAPTPFQHVPVRPRKFFKSRSHAPVKHSASAPNCSARARQKPTVKI